MATNHREPSTIAVSTAAGMPRFFITRGTAKGKLTAPARGVKATRARLASIIKTTQRRLRLLDCCDLAVWSVGIP